jgi:hypothetical protein
LLFEHDLFGKPVSTFPDHALAVASVDLEALARNALALVGSQKNARRAMSSGVTASGIA